LLRYVNRIVDRMQFDSKLKSVVELRWSTFGRVHMVWYTWKIGHT